MTCSDKEWFELHYPEPEPEFEAWWLAEYGPPESYLQEKDEQNEYWVRKGFALMGWRARVR